MIISTLVGLNGELNSLQREFLIIKHYKNKKYNIRVNSIYLCIYILCTYVIKIPHIKYTFYNQKANSNLDQDTTFLEL